MGRKLRRMPYSLYVMVMLFVLDELDEDPGLSDKGILRRRESWLVFRSRQDVGLRESLGDGIGIESLDVCFDAAAAQGVGGTELVTGTVLSG